MSDEEREFFCKDKRNRIPKSNFIEPCKIGILFNDRLSFKKSFTILRLGRKLFCSKKFSHGGPIFDF